MNKELTPLEALEKIKNHCENLIINVLYGYEKELKIIETALKDYEKITSGDFHIEPINVHIENQKQIKEYEVMKQTKIIVADKKISDDDLDKLMNQRVFVGNLEPCEIKPLFDEETQNKFKALEIIKEKEVNILWLYCSFELNCSSKEQCENYNRQWIYLPCKEEHYLTQEEYDLLKEVLL